MRRVVLAVTIALICGLSTAGAIEVYNLVAPAHSDPSGNGAADGLQCRRRRRSHTGHSED